MAKKRSHERKVRTRGHIIADLSVNHVERQVLLAGFAVQRIVRDYGIDLFIATFDVSGGLENGEIRVQIKATDAPEDVRDDEFIAVRVSQSDFRHWLLEPMPLILVVYDAPRDEAYWLYIQADFERRNDTKLLLGEGARMTLHVPRRNLLAPSSMKQFAEYRNRMHAQMKGLQHHG